MFNKKLKTRLAELESKIQTVHHAVFVPDYFENCPCCENDGELLKSEAVKFNKLWVGWAGSHVQELYTTEHGYELHKEAIKKWEKEAKEFEDSFKRS